MPSSMGGAGDGPLGRGEKTDENGHEPKRQTALNAL